MALSGMKYVSTCMHVSKILKTHFCYDGEPKIELYFSGHIQKIQIVLRLSRMQKT